MGNGDRVGVWRHPALRAALIDRDWAGILRTWRRLTGSSQTRLGGLVGLAQPDVSAIERGRRAVTSAEVQQRILDGLGAPDDLVRPRPAPVPALELPGLAPDVDLLDRVAGAVTEPARVDAETVDYLDRLLAEHRRAEDTLGSRPLVGLMREQLATVVRLHSGARGPLARRLVRLAAEHAQFLAWMAQDQGVPAAALAWYDRSHDWSIEAGDANMAATTLSMKAHMAWSVGQGERCAAFGQAARRSTPGTSPGVQGMAAQMVARGRALTGDADGAWRLLDEAQTLIAGAAEHPEDEPPWMYFYGETWFTLQRGMAGLHLRQWRRAAADLAAGLDALPTSYRRDRTWYRVCLARAHAEAGDVDQALAVALAAAPDAAEVGRPHSWDSLHKVAAVLRRRGAPQARELADALR